MNISINRTLFLSYLVKFLVLVFIAKLISLSILFFLPKTGIQSGAKTDFVMPYMRYSIDDFRLKASEGDQAEGSSALSIDSIVLKAVYYMGDESLVVVAPKVAREKSKTLSLGELFEGYKLVKVYADYVEFEKDFKIYKLYISKPKISSRWKDIPKGALSQVEEPVRRIASTEVKKTLANPTNIWKNISLAPYLKNGVPDGFKVGFVRNGTIFEALGLKVGDIIQSVNNKELKNNAQAFSAYQEFKDAKALKLTVLRGNTILELEYEVY